jgi:hypothetical protein
METSSIRHGSFIGKEEFVLEEVVSLYPKRMSVFGVQLRQNSFRFDRFEKRTSKEPPDDSTRGILNTTSL